MKCSEIITLLEQEYGKEYACDWDNVGLLVGREDKEIQKIYIALDATDEAIEEAIANGADMLLTHHPMIFKGMKRVTQEDFIGRRIIRLIQNDMVYYAMHTNYDILGMADLSARIWSFLMYRFFLLQGKKRVNRLVLEELARFRRK